jgi:hypothetical protein
VRRNVDCERMTCLKMEIDCSVKPMIDVNYHDYIEESLYDFSFSAWEVVVVFCRAIAL